MSDAQFQITPSDDGATAKFEMVADGKALAEVVLTSDQLQGLVEYISAVRMMLPGAVSQEPPQGEQFAVLDPAWRSPGTKVAAGLPIAFRHPGLGWGHFIFPEEKAAKLAQLMTADLPEATPSAAG